MYGELFLPRDKEIIVNEAYFGKTDTLLELEKAIGDLRKDYTNFRDYEGSPEVTRINRLVEKQFGMEVFSFNIIPQSTINAFTYTVGGRIDVALNKEVSKKVIATSKDGYRFKPNNGFCIVMCVYGGLLEMKNVTDAEIVAVMLHEIGHNFADAISNKIEVANHEYAEAVKSSIIIRAILTLGITLIPDLIMYNNDKNSTVIKRERNKKENTNPIHNYIYGKKGQIEDWKINVSEFFSRLQYNDINYYKDTYTKKDKERIQTSVNRQNEIIADKFAGIYGYGPEQASCLAKMTFDTDKSAAYQWTEKLPWGHEVNLGFENAYKDINEYDCHPHVIQRANAEINTLKEELKNPKLDPKVATVIRSQIKELEAIKKDMLRIRDDQDEAEVIARTYAAVVNNEMPDATKKELEKSIDKQINALIDKRSKK